MTATQSAATPALGAADIDRLLEQVADGFGDVGRLRAPVLHRPDEMGMAFEEVSFAASDGVPLDGWFIPAPGSDKLVIANHPMGFSRSGQPTHLDPWHAEWAPSGNGFEVNLIPDYRILHDAGYNVLCYDLRNHGLSSAANGGRGTSGWYEARDVIGSLRYARSRIDTRDMTVGLFSRCLGCNSTFAAMAQSPQEFSGVRCLVAPMPVTTEVIVHHQLALAGVPAEGLDEAMADLDRRIRVRTSLGFADRDNREWARHVTIPTFLYQVRDDVLTDPSDMQTMYNNLPVEDKRLQWVERTTARWDGYLEFQRRPEPMLRWFADHMT